MRHKPKVIFIDWHNTLSASLFWDNWSTSSHPKNELFKTITTTLFGSLSPEIHSWMRGGHTSESIIQLLCKSTGLNYEEVLTEFVNSCESMQLFNPNILELINLLKKQGFVVAIATDNMDSFHRFTAPKLELDKHFDYILNSHQLGYLKGDVDSSGSSLFFKAFLSCHNFLPEDCLLIDDGVDKNGRLASWGINYWKIESPRDLTPALQKLLDSY